MLFRSALSGFCVLRRLFAGQEAVCPRAQIVHGYGPTETTIFVTFYMLPLNGQLESGVPIGKSMAAMRACVLDDGLQHCPVSVAGELYRAGSDWPRAMQDWQA